MRMFALFTAGIALVFSSVGCCCLTGGYGCGTGCGTGCAPTYGYGGGCATGNCGVAPLGAPQGFAPQGMYQNYNTIQTGYAGSITSPVVAAPPVMTTSYPQPIYSGVAPSPFAIPHTASAPLESLPTY